MKLIVPEAKEIKIDINYIKNNYDNLYKEIFFHINHYDHYKIIDKSLSKKSLTLFLLLFIILIIIIPLPSLNTHIIFKISLLSFSLLSSTIIIIRLTKFLKQKNHNYLIMISKKLSLIFEDSNINTLLNIPISTQTEYKNITSNIPFSFIKNYIWLPNIAIIDTTSKKDLVVGNRLSSALSCQTLTVEGSNAYIYKYKKLLGQRWKYQRKDGQADKRYSNNTRIDIFQVYLSTLLGFETSIPDIHVIRQTKQLWNFENVVTKYPLILKNIENKINSPIDCLDDIKKFLNYHNINFNDYGESLELNVNKKTYIILNNGIVEGSNLSISQIIRSK